MTPPRAPGARSPLPADPSMGQVLERMFERDENQNDTLFQVASRLGSLTTAVEGTQERVAELVSLHKAQAEFNERQIRVAEQAGRAFEDLKEITRNLDTTMTKVAEYSGGLSTLRWVVGIALTVVIALGLPAAGFAYRQLEKSIDRLEAQVVEMQKGRATK